MLNTIGNGLGPNTHIYRSADWNYLKSSTSFSLSGLLRNRYRVSCAQIIRNRAGLESGQAAGIQAGETAGLTNVGALVADAGPITYSSYASVLADADSGTGTSSDPFVIENRDFTNSESTGGAAITVNSGVADLYIIIRNCRFRNYQGQCISVNTLGAGARVIIQNCDLDDNSASGDGIRISTVGNTNPVQIQILNNRFSGFNEEAIINFGGSATIQNNLFTGSGWGSFSACIQDESAGGTTLIIQSNRFETNTEVNLNLNGGSAYEIYNNYIAGGQYGMTQIGISGEISNLICENNIFTEQTRRAVSLDDLDGGVNNKDRTGNVRFYHNEIEHLTTGEGLRLFVLGSNTGGGPGQWCANVDVAYCKFTKATGRGASSNAECAEMFKALNSGFRWCWVTEVADDEAFEFAFPIGGQYVEYCVGDNVSGQVVDFYHQWDEASDTEQTVQANATDTNGYIHHLYGDCDSYGVIISGLHGVRVHDIYVDNTAASSSEPLVFIGNGLFISKDIRGAGPFSLSADRAGSAVQIAAGTNCEFRFFDSESGAGSMTTVTNP